MLRTRLLFAAMILSIAAAAQNEPLTDATIKTGNGTLSGFVRNASDPSTPQFFSFSTAKSGPFRSIPLNEIERVELADGSIFERHYIEVPLLSAPELERRKSSYGPELYFKGAALVQKVVSGKLSLYSFEDRYEMPHFFFTENQDTALTLLTYEPYVTENSQMEGSSGFRNPLNRLAISMGCSESLSQEVTRASYTERSLTSMFQRLNQCDGGLAAKVNGRGAEGLRTRVRLGAMASGTLQFKSTSAKAGFQPSSKLTAFNPAIGAFADFFTARRNESNVLTVGLYFSPVSRSTVFTYPNSGFYATASEEDKFTASQLGLELSARHLYGSSVIRPFFEGGFLVHSSFSQKVTRTITDTNGNSQVTKTNTAGSHLGIEALVGTGVQLNRGSLHLRYSRGVAAENISSVTFSLRIRF
jgi:hypothetical protein